ncbi:hypothetical protein C5167_021122 [Papaver somniferum]|uniref:Germin-like protein n=1 Tax=Papaver somniferum TaxID=3469 RepID=A0A4Y7IZ56_PAPSO|nr:hypothetical protein C5167_021122 [Papaver somniferum]
MKNSKCCVVVVFLVLFSLCVSATDPGSLQDFFFVNGLFCKDPKLAVAEDFYLANFNKPGDYAPMGLNPPHTHPRTSEILIILEGTLHVGFVTSNPENKLFTKVLYKGDIFVFPVGLIHFQVNVRKTPAVAIAALSSQNPGVITIANAVFGSKAPIYDDVLAKAFQVDKKVVDYLQSQFWMEN